MADSMAQKSFFISNLFSTFTKSNNKTLSKMKNIVTLLIGDFNQSDIIPFIKQVAFLVGAITLFSLLS